MGEQEGLDCAVEAMQAGDEAAFQEQQRLRTARDEADRQLATLIDGEMD